ncbi:hypothetical protein EB001_17735 [bacterium]|nr:hypothetical protein [bacterium]
MSKVAWDYIVPIVMPKDLKGVEPGKLPESLLRAIPTGGKLHWRAANAWNAMVAKAKADGVELKPTSSGDLYRSYESQLAGFKQRYVLEPIQGTSTKTFEGKTWYLKKGMAMLATPGKSNHNLGIAVDVHSASEPKRLNWLIANVKDFGFSWEVVPSEPWHLRYVCGDTPPPAVVAFTGGTVETPVVNLNVAPPVAAHLDSDKALQQALKDKGFYDGPVDGNIGPKTNDAVKAFKIANKLNADSVVGPKVKELLGLK